MTKLVMCPLPASYCPCRSPVRSAREFFSCAARSASWASPARAVRVSSGARRGAMGGGMSRSKTSAVADEAAARSLLARFSGLAGARANCDSRTRSTALRKLLFTGESGILAGRRWDRFWANADERPQKPPLGLGGSNLGRIWGAVLNQGCDSGDFWPLESAPSGRSADSSRVE